MSDKSKRCVADEKLMVASIEFIEKIIEYYNEAARLNLDSDCRVGSIVEIKADAVDEVMITGDLHGNRHNFNAIRRIADLRNHARRHLILQEVCHGGPTYPANGGCMSHTLLEDVAKLITEFPGRVHFLLGNHEWAELTDYPIQKNGQMLNLMFRLPGERGRQRVQVKANRSCRFPVSARWIQPIGSYQKI